MTEKSEIEKDPSITEWENLHGSCKYPDGSPVPDGIISNSHPDGYVRAVREGQWTKFTIPQEDGT